MNTEFSKMIIRFFQNYNRLERLKKINAPEEIIHKEENMLQSLMLQFLSAGFDIDKYMHSPEGSCLYLQWIAEYDHIDKVLTKCHKCENFSYIDNYWKCPIHGDNVPFNCQEYKDAMEDSVIKLQRNLSERCSKCIHFFETPIPELSFQESKCRLHLNMASTHCDSYKEL